MNWQNIIKATEKDWESLISSENEAVQKLTRDDIGLYFMGHSEIGSVNNYLKKLMDDDPEHDPTYSEILQLSQKLEVTMDNLEDYLLETQKLLQDIGL